MNAGARGRVEGAVVEKGESIPRIRGVENEKGVRDRGSLRQSSRANGERTENERPVIYIHNFNTKQVAVTLP